MLGPFDIYKMDDLDATVWVDATWTLEDAKVSVKEMMAEKPSEYIIFNLSTRERMLIKPGDLVG
jgi:hypothetical protein